MTIRVLDNKGNDYELFSFDASYREAKYMLKDLVRKLIGNISDDICVSPRGLSDGYNIRRFEKGGELIEEINLYLY